MRGTCPHARLTCESTASRVEIGRNSLKCKKSEVQKMRRAPMGQEDVGEDEMAAAKERLRQITPSSRYWPQVEAVVCMLQPDKEKQGRPPYFFDE